MFFYEMTSVRRFVVSAGLGNFLSIEIDDEPMSQTHLVGGAIIQGDAGHERGLKPTAMLIGCFEIHVGRVTQFRMSGANSAVLHAATDPDVDGVVAFGGSFRQFQLARE